MMDLVLSIHTTNPTLIDILISDNIIKFWFKTNKKGIIWALLAGL